ncbi:MAG: hypothetical protein A3E87_03400 [Gammaproteobacteria bacterium RIFCSPHIGHO2_12_FULL_35_23]|nr:MAG: hypothetical protein A3E87_03400 [Gammaproteobacteria bacterium RIFCSPHIGHO2_12_FULL_35_23]
MLVDSHCHLNRLGNEKELDAIILAATQNGVQQMLTVGVRLNEFPAVLAIAEKYAQIDCSVGAHPTDAEDEQINAEKMLQLATHSKVVAIGETGLDYYRLAADNIIAKTQQQENFRLQIRVALQVDKPLIIHTRMAVEDTLRLLREEKASLVQGVMHCFTENWEMAKAALELGFYISISGIVTFKKAFQVQEVASKVPLDRLLIETDSPYLAPEPMRGKPNQPAYVRYVAEFIAKLRNESFETIAMQTTKNYNRLFKRKEHV